MLNPHTALANSLPQSVPPLSADALRNATYTVSEVANPVTLQDGLYTDPAVPLNVALTAVQANGDLNGDGAEDAVVILSTNLGGTADLVDLAVVLNEDGTAKPMATAFLGDSIHVESLKITNQQIVVSLLVMGPEDAQCCPTQMSTATYTLVGDQLVRKPTKAFGRLLAFPQGNRYGYVNVLGEFAIAPQFVFANEFSEGLASVSVDGQTTGFINRLGEMVIAPQFVYAGKFVQGLANVGLPNPDADQPFVVSYIDRRGALMFNGARFAAAEPFSEGLAAVSVDGKSYGYINRAGQFVIEPQFAYAESFSEGVAAVQMGEQFGYIDTSGQVVIAAQYEFAKPFSEGLAVITLNRKTRYIDHQGKVVIEPQFDYGHDFKEGRALVALAGQEHYIDSSGQFLAADLTFTEGQDFSQGLAAVKLDARFGYLNLDGELVIPPTFTYAGVFDRDIALAQTDDVQGIIDPTGAWLLAVPRFALDGVVVNLSDATATQVIDYVPNIPEAAYAGKCSANSSIVASSSAWRCVVGSDTYDPCLTAADGQTLVCAANRATAEPGFKLDLTAPLPAAQPAVALPSPIWLFQSGDNVTCTALAALTVQIDGKPITHNFNLGSYRFTARADDGVRVWIDNQPIIDQWHISSGNVDYTADRYMYGNQSVRVEHYDEGAGALLNFSFAPIGTVNPGVSTGSDWDASYFNNPDLAGGPVIVRGEARSSYPLDLDWGLNSPAPGAVANDNWSARWRGRFFFEAGDFIFQARSDDGVRVYIDGIRLIDAWYDGYKEPSNRFLQIGRGDHEIVVEFYERGGTAFNRVWWYREGTSSGAGGSGGDVPHRNRDE